MRLIMKLSNILSARNWILLRELVVTDFKLRYQGSALGYAWSVLKPLFLFAIIYFVFVYGLGIGKDIEHFPVYLLLGMVLWGFFTEATANGLSSIISRGDLIRKINFPKYIIVVSATVSALINLAINLAVVLVFILFNGVDIGWRALWIFPIIFELYIFALAIAFFLSAVNVKFRDIGHLWDIFLQAAFYATPIIYPVSMLVDKHVNPVILKIIMINPVTQIIQDARYVLVTQATTVRSVDILGGWLAYMPFILIAILIFLASYYFRKNSKTFAEQI